MLFTSPAAAFVSSPAYPACVMECRLKLIQLGLIIALIMHGAVYELASVTGSEHSRAILSVVAQNRLCIDYANI
ncbi:hypothetical protein PR048_003048 [Dryococelus australis]|uniref:Uncharacterized protein n=1 Tax=Dryococelus australis TaxID=614101 RepID=A0ABQ9IP70_9NEOP|nr:hypothetical protein PR048_003048 [Dryococelus australis]